MPDLQVTDAEALQYALDQLGKSEKELALVQQSIQFGGEMSSRQRREYATTVAVVRRIELMLRREQGRFV